MHVVCLQALFITLSKMPDIPTSKQLFELYHDDESCVRFLDDQNIFYKSFPCSNCGLAMHRRLDRMKFRCSAKTCDRREVSIRKGTFFFGSMLKCIDIMEIARLWLAGTTPLVTHHLAGHSKSTIAAFFRHFRMLVGSTLEPEDQMIGGNGVIVEIDETKMGKRKYHRGHHVDGVWVVAGIERTQTGKVFATTVEDRSAATLTSLISAHVMPGSIVYTDLWKGYGNIESQLGLTHNTVNHSKCFKDPISGVCTNKVEGLNNALKMKISPRNRVKGGMNDHLLEFIWRRRHRGNLWNAFLKALRDIHYDME
jgi:transposase-like protein